MFLFVGPNIIYYVAIHASVYIFWFLVKPHYEKWQKKRAAEKHKREFDEVLRRVRERVERERSMQENKE